MRDFSDTAAAEIETDSYEDSSQFDETNWMKPGEAVGLTLIATRANEAETKYGWKFFLHVEIEDDPEKIDYTVSFSNKSAAYAQLTKIVTEQGDKGFPFRCMIGGIGKTFRLEPARPRQTPQRAAVAAEEMGGSGGRGRPPVRPAPPRPGRQTSAAEDTEGVPF